MLAVAAALGLTAGSGQIGLAEPPVAAFLAAILVTGWYAGLGPVVLATLLSALVFDFFFVPPIHHLDVARVPNPRLVWFLMFAVLAASFSAARRRDEELLKRARDELEQRVAARTAELQRAERARFTAMLDERNRLARELHDTLLQGFTGVALKLVAITNEAAGAPAIVAQLRDLVDLAQGTLTDARRSVWDLRSAPPVGADLPAALRSAAEHALRGTDLTLEFATEGQPVTVDPEIEAVVRRVTREALANLVKHAAARTVRLTLGYEVRWVRLSIADDGRGFVVHPDLHSYGGHWGLLGMRERAIQLHGTLTVRSAPGAGTEIALLVPLGRPSPPDRDSGQKEPAREQGQDGPIASGPGPARTAAQISEPFPNPEGAERGEQQPDGVLEGVLRDRGERTPRQDGGDQHQDPGEPGAGRRHQ